MENITSMYTDEPDLVDNRLIVWTVLYSIITIVGVIGNFTVIWIVLAHKRMRTVTNLFIVNLAIADGFPALLNVPLIPYGVILFRCPFGSVYYKIHEAIATTSICVSVLTLCVIAIDQFMAIVYPFKRRLDKTKTNLVIIAIWLLSFVVSAPNWIFITLDDTEDKYWNIVYACTKLWPNNHLEEVYNVFFIIVSYLVPLTYMGYYYNRIGAILWGSKAVGVQNETELVEERDKKKVVKMMIMVVLIFAICWFPTHLVYVLFIGGFFDTGYLEWEECYLVSFWFAMSHSMYNPIIYCWMNDRFRAGFKKAFKCLPYVNYNPADCEVFSSNVTSKLETIV